MYVPITLCTSVIDSVVVSGCRSFGVGSTWRQRSRADGAESDGVLEPLSLQMFAVRYRARLVLTV